MVIPNILLWIEIHIKKRQKLMPALSEDIYLLIVHNQMLKIEGDQNFFKWSSNV